MAIQKRDGIRPEANNASCRAEPSLGTVTTQAPPGVTLGSRNFGRDRRYPITHAFRTA